MNGTFWEGFYWKSLWFKDLDQAFAVGSSGAKLEWSAQMDDKRNKWYLVQNQEEHYGSL